jgi:hypothetical protein
LVALMVHRLSVCIACLLLFTASLCTHFVLGV